MKDIFGSRVAIQEMQIFMDSIPSLSQTDEGKRAIIKNMRLANDAWKYIKQTKDRIARKVIYRLQLVQVCPKARIVAKVEIVGMLTSSQAGEARSPLV